MNEFTKQQIDEWIRANGGPGAIQHATTTTKVENPVATEAGAQAAGVEWDATAPKTVDVYTDVWVNSVTGAKLTAAHNPAKPGTYLATQVSADPARVKAAAEAEATKKTGQGTLVDTKTVERDGQTVTTETWRMPDGSTETRTKSTRKEPTERKERVDPKNPGRKQRFDPNATNPEGGRGDWVDAGPIAQTTAPKDEVDPTNPTRLRRWDPTKENEDGTLGGFVDAGPVAQATPYKEEIDPANPTRMRKWDPNALRPGGGKGAWVDAGPKAVPQKVEPIKGVPHAVVMKPDGVTIDHYAPIPIKQDPLPSGIEPYRPDATKTGLGIIERRDYLDQLWRDGVLTQAQRDQIIERDYETAKLAKEQADQIVTTQLSGHDRQVAQRDADVKAAQYRGSLTQNAFTNAQAQVGKMVPDLPAGSGEVAARGQMAMVAMALKLAEEQGALDRPREVPLPPAVAQMMKLKLPNGAELEMPAQSTVTAPGPNAVGPAAGPTPEALFRRLVGGAAEPTLPPVVESPAGPTPTGADTGTVSGSLVDTLLQPAGLEYDPTGMNQRLQALGIGEDILAEVGTRYAGRRLI